MWDNVTDGENYNAAETNACSILFNLTYGNIWKYFIKGSRNVDVQLNVSFINKFKIAVKKKSSLKETVLKGNESSLLRR